MECWRKRSHTLYGCVDWNTASTSLKSYLKRHTLYGCVDWNILIVEAIETKWGHTLYGCVDWNRLRVSKRSSGGWVTPCMGVWIETITMLTSWAARVVTPCMGVWIETASCLQYRLQPGGHTLYGCVDWNDFYHNAYIKSRASHPVWVCGLKPIRWYARCAPWTVTPCMGVWIETF